MSPRAARTARRSRAPAGFPAESEHLAGAASHLNAAAAPGTSSLRPPGSPGRAFARRREQLHKVWGSRKPENPGSPPSRAPPSHPVQWPREAVHPASPRGRGPHPPARLPRLPTPGGETRRLPGCPGPGALPSKTRDPRMNQHRGSLLVCYFACHPFNVNRLYRDAVFPSSTRGNQSLSRKLSRTPRSKQCYTPPRHSLIKILRRGTIPLL